MSEIGVGKGSEDEGKWGLKQSWIMDLQREAGLGGRPLGRGYVGYRMEATTIRIHDQ